MADFQSRSAFALAATRLSRAQLKATAKHYDKTVPRNRDSKYELAGLLEGVLTAKQQIEALRTFMLAGRHSMHVFRFPTLRAVPTFDVSFTHATATPQIVYAGAVGEIIVGQRLIMWAVLDGTYTFTDASLAIQTNPEAVVYVSFYDEAAKMLVVRSGESAAEKIRRCFATLAELDVGRESQRLAIRDRAEMYAFGELLNANVVKAKGRTKKPKGFDIVSGQSDDNTNLKGSVDYEAHVKLTDPIQEDLTFNHNGVEVKIGVAFEARALVFRTGVSEAVAQFVYENLKRHLKLDQTDGGASS